MLGHKLKKADITIVREYESGLPHVNAIGNELNQVWTNLIDNAIDSIGKPWNYFNSYQKRAKKPCACRNSG